jgi:uncharacterized protein
MPAPLVHLELHTDDLARACAFYAAVCGWRVETVRGYRALEWNGAIGGGVVECGTTRPAWLPYVEVRDVDAATARAERLGAAVLLAPRSGPEGRRSVVAVAGGAELGFWEPS